MIPFLPRRQDDNLHEMSGPVFKARCLEIIRRKKKYLKMLSAEFFTKHALHQILAETV